MRARDVAFLLLLVLLIAPSSSVGQGRPPIEHSNVVSANPFLLLFEWFNAEYERKASPTTTLGLRASTITIGADEDLTGTDTNVRYLSGRAFFRYYPSGAFQRFFVGVGAGATGIKDESESATAMALGFDLGYNWLLGSRRNFYVSLGLGVERLFGTGDLDNVDPTLPSIRIINIGFAF